ncbi:unnamed protein product [Arabidopsis thaliana]|uniref:Uncharacterized protein n=1 Tax=Arabidopsis thaliana TaxID=3702 RepID=A0A5S9WZK7_ARATH|nr:unnamed protein product [Arabidopsis thaliana]
MRNRRRTYIARETPPSLFFETLTVNPLFKRDALRTLEEVGYRRGSVIQDRGTKIYRIDSVLVFYTL